MQNLCDKLAKADPTEQLLDRLLILHKTFCRFPRVEKSFENSSPICILSENYSRAFLSTAKAIHQLNDYVNAKCNKMNCANEFESINQSIGKTEIKVLIYCFLTVFPSRRKRDNIFQCEKLKNFMLILLHVWALPLGQLVSYVWGRFRMLKFAWKMSKIFLKFTIQVHQLISL